jgi:hypothetical protein
VIGEQVPPSSSRCAGRAAGGSQATTGVGERIADETVAGVPAPA